MEVQLARRVKGFLVVGREGGGVQAEGAVAVGGVVAVRVVVLTVR